jgi:CRP-like cAMP-binding protein
MNNPFKAKIWQVIDNFPTKKDFVRGDFLLREGEIECNTYFIEKGAVRIFLMNDSEEQTIKLGYTGCIINSLTSCFTKEPSKLYIEVIRKSTIKIIPNSYLEEFVNENSENLQQYKAFLK